MPPLPIEATVETSVHGRYLVRPHDSGRLVLGFHGYGESADVQMQRLLDIPGSDEEFVKNLLIEKQVMVVHGSGFCSSLGTPPQLLSFLFKHKTGLDLHYIPYKGSAQSITDMIGGGPFNLQAGEWTDDTAMALCLADSLIASDGGLDPADRLNAARAEDDLLDTPWLQRLRRISQLQSARWVFPTAEHSRFTHGLGVMHEAGLWARSLYPSLREELLRRASDETPPSEGLVVETLRVAGLLHDVVEDSDWTFERLREEGFSETVIEALKHVTKLPGEEDDYDAFIRRAAKKAIDQLSR